jgi:hypothetical protein
MHASISLGNQQLETEEGGTQNVPVIIMSNDDYDED